VIVVSEMRRLNDLKGFLCTLQLCQVIKRSFQFSMACIGNNCMDVVDIIDGKKLAKLTKCIRNLSGKLP
jgi:hypothetical protein